MTDKNDVQSQAILANLESSGNRFGPRGTISFMDKPLFKNPIQRGYVKGIRTLANNLAQNATVTTPINEGEIKDEKFELQPIDHQLYPTTIRELENLPLSRQFAPVFSAEVARRHLYKSLIVRMNEELAQGPLAGLITITGVHRENDPKALISVSFELTVKMITTRSGDLRPSFKAMNRSKAYETYFTNLRRKYVLEIRESEDKVMERE